MKYLVTGTTGFIRCHLVPRLYVDGHEVVGDYYEVSLKEARLDPSQGGADMSATPYRLFNIGNGSSVHWTLSRYRSRSSSSPPKNMMPIPHGDVPAA
ncbi:hypothetical protein D3C85_1161250 [compost metagenome]